MTEIFNILNFIGVDDWPLDEDESTLHAVNELMPQHYRWMRSYNTADGYYLVKWEEM